jgi:large subunit ribosomal protein L30
LKTVAEKTLKTVRIKWVRSGIGFTHHQKTIVRSLGLNKLNHTVVRPDTPQIRGIVASVPHLLEIVPEPLAKAWSSIPEYTVYAPVAAPPASSETATVTATEAVGSAVAVEAAAPEAESAKADQKSESSPEGTDPAETGKE